MEGNRALTGIKVIELATFVAAPSATRFLADQGAEVIKVEPINGDNLRYCAATDGIPEDPFENITFDIENGNKKSVCMNLKNPECFNIFMKLLESADVFVTNWRPQALKKMNLDYECLKEKFPKLVYGSITGYGDMGPDKDLPGYDGTAFFTRSGILGSTYEKGTVPMNLVPSMGDRQAGMCLAAGILAALYKARETGKGERVSVSLLATAIFMQATLLQSSQYGKVKWPVKKTEMINPLMTCYKTKDGRFIQLALPVFEIFFKKFANAMGHPEWMEDKRFQSIKTLDEADNREKLYCMIQSRFLELTSEEASDILTQADLPFAVAREWDEVLEDEQAWATDCFLKKEYPSGERIIVRQPVRFLEAGLPEYNYSPQLGEDTEDVLEALGYAKESIEKMLEEKTIICQKRRG